MPDETQTQPEQTHDETWVVRVDRGGDYPGQWTFGPFADEGAADAFRDAVDARAPQIPGHPITALVDVLTFPEAAEQLIPLMPAGPPKPGPPQPPGVGEQRNA